MHFSGKKKGTGEVARPNGPTGEAKQESGGTEQISSGAVITARSVSRTSFRVRLRAVLRPRVRAGRSETLAGKRERTSAANLGSLEELEREISRSRRFGHSFFLARFPRPRRRAEADGWHEPTLALLSSLIRTVDRVWSDGKDVYLLLPESDRAMGTAALMRLRQPLSQVLSEEELADVTFVVFAPSECPTSRALLSGLHQRVRDAKAQKSGALESPGTPVADPKGARG